MPSGASSRASRLVRTMLLVPPASPPLRRVAMPGLGIEIAELFVLHLVKLDIELHRLVVRIAMVGRDIVARAVAHRSPQQA